ASVTASGSVTIDESAGQQADDTLNAAVSALFAGVVNPGSDPTQLPQYATQTGLVSTTGSSAGADNEGATTAISLAIVGGNGADSLLDTTDGKSIFLFKEGNLICGRYETDGVAGITTADAAAFAIAVDSTTGQVSLAQYVSLHHGSVDTGDISEANDLTGLINAVVTVTDGDGDHVSATTDIGDQIQFLDDGPTASVTASGSVTIDEGAVQQADDTLNAAVSALFAGVTNPGSDPTQLPQYATQTGLVSTTGSSAGADNEGATTAISLAIVGGNWTDSLLDTTDGKSIFLFKEGNLIVGRY